MKRVIKYARKVGAALIGFPLLIVGIILVPLPGPGLLVCLLALIILALEFDWAKPYLEKIKTEFKKIIAKAKAKQKEIDKKYK